MHVEIKITLNGGNDMLHEETYCICKKDRWIIRHAYNTFKYVYSGKNLMIPQKENILIINLHVYSKLLFTIMIKIKFYELQLL